MQRPDHDDFWRLCECVQDLDTAAEDVRLERILDNVDQHSLAYVATQRALRALGVADRQVALSATWIDGFTAGMLFQRRRSEPFPHDDVGDSILDHWPELLGSDSQIVVYCKCGAEFRDTDQFGAATEWAKHLGENIP